ncbi:hypothetical protein ACFYZB_22230 [Streptomyces sp. NPDC001852]|uniref:hypothetical protein n=1 Tax=Streptomyces sp. NPDC001852 TaxID=3364619 RepID=UPI0036C308C0
MAVRMPLCTRTTGYRHDSIPDAAAAVRSLGRFAVEHTEDPANLERPPAGSGSHGTSGRATGFAEAHAAACSGYGRLYHGELLGARFVQFGSWVCAGGSGWSDTARHGPVPVGSCSPSSRCGTATLSAGRWSPWRSRGRPSSSQVTAWIAVFRPSGQRGPCAVKHGKPFT